jgi:hypothetical protein
MPRPIGQIGNSNLARLLRLSGIWPAQHDWLRRYFVFERATYALEEFVAAVMSIYISGLQRKYGTV